MKRHNLFSDIPADLPQELTELLSQNSIMRIERITSLGHKSPEDFWYDQNEDEWVLLVQGNARLQFENEADDLQLSAGDHLLIPAHKRHRVSWTDPDHHTIWLAIFSKAPLS